MPRVALSLADLRVPSSDRGSGSEAGGGSGSDGGLGGAPSRRGRWHRRTRSDRDTPGIGSLPATAVSATTTTAAAVAVARGRKPAVQDMWMSALKQLSASSPAMTAAPAAPASCAGPAAGAATTATSTSTPTASTAPSGTGDNSSIGSGSPVILEETTPLALSSSMSSAVSVLPPLVPVSAMTPMPMPLPLPSPGSSKARQKKFHRHFKSVDADERVINYYSCALVADILLQGHLYITKNYFAFYSNVFGYVTKLLIPTVSVLQVSKEKTARIIPNAVGIATENNKHVFGSLLSRDSTYKLMVQVWELAMSSATPALELPPPKEVVDDALEDSLSGDLLLAEDDDSSLSGSGVECPVEPSISPEIQTESTSRPLVTECPITALPSTPGSSSPYLIPAAEKASESLPRPTVLLLVTTGLLILLFTFAGVLLYRIGQIQEQLGIHRDDLYPDLVRWQSQLHTRSASQVEQFLDTHLNQLAKVRQSLEALSLLIVDSEESPGMMPPPLQQQQQQQEEREQGEVHRKEPRRSPDSESIKQWSADTSAQSSNNKNS